MTRATTQLALGLAALGRPGYITVGHAEDLGGHYDAAAMEQRSHAVLDAAWDAGIRWFDAARSYGRAEEFLASWLRTRKIAPGDVTVSSKWGYTYVANWQVNAKQHEIKDHSLAALTRQVEESKGLLGPYLSLYQVHSATLESGILDDRAVLSKLGELRDGGLPIGLSLSGARQREALERALTIEVGGKPLWSAVQATWNLLERSVEPALLEAKRRGLRVMIKEALANGRLVGTYAPEALRNEAARAKVGTDAMALAVVMAQPWVDVVLSGATTPAQLLDNVRAREVDGSAAAAVSSLASLAQTADRYWAERSKLPWT
ncbi:L-fuco-beta-pyranose dehydrogenase [Labilithrix luteola]|uniref:L-fuco-beta-pyranose dehydrogenase n=1 Tax=Labilithrix luteola TaxID=1391654 RepID=A0A0K1Q3M3_9BACT|nr:aldo/keto reductase [Labilithrix luteola]AKV00349.1 L-fuco-beta-pyranose dehydrogenase [Labilithrix luteola]